MKQKKFWALAGILLSAVAVSIYVGRYPLTLQDLWAIFTGTEKGMGQRVFLQIRLPRTFLVLFCGAALSVSGMIYQHIFRNPLVSPDVLGVTSGASVGAAFAIMTFNNDASVTDVFREIYRMVLGHEGQGFSVLELSYSVGLALGVILFFNHFCAWKVNTDPTPLEVEMRLYEDNISKTVIQNDGRKESGIDVN